MKSLKQTLIVLTLLAPFTASANVAEDMARIRALLPAGTDIAQVQVNLARHATQQEVEQIAASMIARFDFNGDHQDDFLVISEENPKLQHEDTEEPCPDTLDPACRWVYGKRFLQYFSGQQDGSLKLVFTNDKMIRQADEGGVFGDPLNGLTVRKNGTVLYGIYGGSAWRWSYTDTIQFRNGDFYMIGLDTYNGWNGDGRGDEKSINLLTGYVIEKHYKNAEDKGTEKHYRVRVKPLKKLSTYEGSGPN